jgi:hypothetical protein
VHDCGSGRCNPDAGNEFRFPIDHAHATGAILREDDPEPAVRCTAGPENTESDAMTTRAGPHIVE